MKEIKLHDVITTTKGDRVSGIPCTGIVYGFGKWKDSKSFKIIQLNGRKTTILEQNAVKLKGSKKQYMKLLREGE